MFRVNRTEFLQRLEAVQPGLSPRDIIEQSACFIFKDSKVITFNDEVSCRADSKLPKEFRGAVPAKPLTDLLSKLPDDTVTVGISDGHFVVRGKKNDEGGVRVDETISLPVDSIEKPGEWGPLPKNFGEAISIVQECAGRDESQFTLTCVHLHPNWVEACDNLQLTRYKIKTGVRRPVLVKRDAIKEIVSLDMTDFNETKSWIHFKNPAGLVYSCRRHVEDYHDLMPLLNLEGGSPIILPKGLGQATNIASIFSSENAEDNQVLVYLRPGSLRVRGTGDSGYYKSRVMKINYTGKKICFRIAPKLLVEIIKRHNEATVSADRLKVNGGKWVYVTCLGQPEKPTPAKTEEEGDESGTEE